MDAENALFRFQEGAQLIRSHGLEVNITQLLLESARKKDEERQQLAISPEPAQDDSGLQVLHLGEVSAEAPAAPAAPLPATTPASPSETSAPPTPDPLALSPEDRSPAANVGS
jgi:hypothetical protein